MAVRVVVDGTGIAQQCVPSTPPPKEPKLCMCRPAAAMWQEWQEEPDDRLLREAQDVSLLMEALAEAPRGAHFGVWRVEYIRRERMARVSRGPFQVKVATEPLAAWPQLLAAAIKAMQGEPVDACW